MRSDRRIDRLIEKYLPAILSGEDTVASILEKHPQDAEDLRPRLEAFAWLIISRQKIEPRQGFIASSRKYIERRFQDSQPQGFWARLTRRYTPLHWVFNISVPVILIFLLVLIINSLVLASQLSIPGDPFYSTKLVLEDVQLAFTLDQVDKTNLCIQLSRERTTELVELVLDGNYELIPAAANRMETEMIASIHAINKIPPQDQDGERLMTAELRETLFNELYILNLLKGSSPPPAHQGIELAIQAAQSGLMAIH